MQHALFDRLRKQLLWIAALAALAYLPHALQLTYYRDDWYYAYDAMIGPAGTFRFMFAADRPLRGPFFELLHTLFGINPIPYHLSMLFWRIAGGLAVSWLFRLLWREASAAGLAAGALFALYPGFTWWVQAIEYQPMVASAALMVCSFGLSLQALKSRRPWLRASCIMGAILTGWLYLALVEYAAGMEVFRLCLIFLAVRDPGLGTLHSRIRVALRRWLPYLIIPASFTLWRFVFFTSARRATDLSAQLGGLLADPVSTGLRWILNLLLSLFNVTLAAWVHPLLSSFFSGPLRDQALGLVLALLAGGLVWVLLRRGQKAPARRRANQVASWPMMAIWLGLAGLLLGILPVIVANRQITLPSFSHYALPASLGLAFLVTGLVSLSANPGVQTALFGGLITLSVLTHQGLGASALREEQAIAGFWRQMVWRAPSIAGETTLLVYYPGVDYGTDSDVAWGPANFIYYPQAQSQLPVQVQLSAVTQDRNSLTSVLARKAGQESTYRSHTMTVDYGNVLIAAQSAPDACVRVLDARWPALSVGDDLALHALAGSSRVDAVQLSSSAPSLPAALFGPEPPHGWCYFFEQAEFAAQRGDWVRVAAIQEDLSGLGLRPNDQIEWMPFLLARAYLGDLQGMKDIATRVNTEKLYKRQACENLASMSGNGFSLPAETQALARELFCGG